MQDAEFEEREYEAPLYNQLERGSDLLWSPGQVFERHIGIDRGMFTLDDLVFQLHGHAGPLRGAALARYGWPRSWFRSRPNRKLPTFRLNLFVQAKRSQWGRRLPARIKKLGIATPFWKFNIVPHQQSALQTVAGRLGARALIVYAAPAFHEHKQLYLHTRLGTIVEHSTFPSAVNLRGHDAWYYDQPGAIGVANSEPQAIEEAPLDERVRRLVGQIEDRTDSSTAWQSDLLDMGGRILEALSSGEVSDSSRLADFFDLQREAERELEDREYRGVLSGYMTVVNFVQAFALDWYVVG